MTASSCEAHAPCSCPRSHSCAMSMKSGSAADQRQHGVPGPDRNRSVERAEHAADAERMPAFQHLVLGPLGRDHEAVPLARQADAEIAHVDYFPALGPSASAATFPVSGMTSRASGCRCRRDGSPNVRSNWPRPGQRQRGPSRAHALQCLKRRLHVVNLCRAHLGQRLCVDRRMDGRAADRRAWQLQFHGGNTCSCVPSGVGHGSG